MSKLIPSLNGLRAISIFCVLIAHIQIMNLNLPDGPGGQIGVNIFFIISGYLITMLLLREEAKTGTVSLKSFFIRRSLRIFPVFYFLLFVYFILQLAGVIYIEPGSWISTMTYTKYFFAKNHHDWETGHTWSLAVEEHFYLVWPVVFLYLRKYRKWFAVVVIVTIPFVRLFSDYSIMHLFTRADALMWGCLFALYNDRIVGFIKSKHPAVSLLPFLILLVCLFSPKLFPLAAAAWSDRFIIAFLGSFGTVTDLCIGLIIMISITFRNNIYFNFLNSRPMDYIGKLSYSIYMWQALFFSRNLYPLSKLPYNLVCIFATAVLSYYFIEQPFLKLKDKYHGKGGIRKMISEILAARSPSKVSV